MAIDTAKFTVLLKPHYNDALKYSKALCAGWQAYEAEDVLQQSFLLALENFESLKDESKFRSWFFKIITTTFYTAIRKHFWRKFLPMDDNFAYIENMPDVYDRALQSESRILLNKALNKLNAKERAALLLFEIAGFSIEEITAIQNEKSLSAVKSRLSRARSRLRKLVEENEKKLYQSADAFGEMNTDLETETLSLISEIRTER